MPGFNAEQQLILSTLVRFHRKSLKLHEMEEFTQYKKKQVIQLIRILRLSVLLNGQRSEDPLPNLQLVVEKEDHWKLTSDDKTG